jgi:hypothetical protein
MAFIESQWIFIVNINCVVNESSSSLYPPLRTCTCTTAAHLLASAGIRIEVWRAKALDYMRPSKTPVTGYQS